MAVNLIQVSDIDAEVRYLATFGYPEGSPISWPDWEPTDSASLEKALGFFLGLWIQSHQERRRETG